MSEVPRWTAANLLSFFRLASAPVLLLLAVAGQRDSFLWLLAAAFLSDAIDGTVARLSGQANRFGAMLDSWADVTIYAVVAVSLFLLWPDVVREERVAVGTLVASFTLPALFGWLRFGCFTSYHTWLVKLAVVATVVGLYLLLLDLSPWPFRVAAVLALIAALEEMVISLVLPEERSNITGLRAALTLRREADRGRGS
jgi:CDP-diacylglycerol--glycerol-3-phosphate 3-phosphatidyltransferase